jgi:hypothetical protein
VLKADLEALDRENAEAYQAQAVELAREQTKAGYQRAQVVARWRWRWAITAVRLELKARIVRRAETRAMVVQFLSKKDIRMSALTLDSMSFELDTTKHFLEQAERERERLAEEREALLQEADQKSSLETRLAQLERAAHQAMARDRMLQDACRAAEGRIGPGRHADERNGIAPCVAQHVGEFLGLAGLGESEHDIILADHAEIAVRGFCGVDEIGLRAGGRHGGSDLARHMAGLADSGTDHAALCGEDGVDRLDEPTVETARELSKGVRLELQDAAGNGDVCRLQHGAGLNQFCVKVICRNNVCMVTAPDG